MRTTSFVLGGAALLSVMGLSAPAIAFTHHPSTAAERKQTDDLNAQALAKAKGEQPLQQQAAATMPEQNNAMTATPQTAAPSEPQNQPAAQPSEPAAPSDQQKTETPQPSPQQ